VTYQGFTIHWFSCEEVVEQTCTHFVYLSSLEMDWYSVLELTASGRLRWKIENEDFDIQKHHGYGLGHQFSRCSMLAMKNYYQLMQIAHMMNQLFELSSLLAEVRGRKAGVHHGVVGDAARLSQVITSERNPTGRPHRNGHPFSLGAL
jgi:hypothetical protein